MSINVGTCLWPAQAELVPTAEPPRLHLRRPPQGQNRCPGPELRLTARNGPGHACAPERRARWRSWPSVTARLGRLLAVDRAERRLCTPRASERTRRTSAQISHSGARSVSGRRIMGLASQEIPTVWCHGARGGRFGLGRRVRERAGVTGMSVVRLPPPRGHCRSPLTQGGAQRSAFAGRPASAPAAACSSSAASWRHWPAVRRAPRCRRIACR